MFKKGDIMNQEDFNVGEAPGVVEYEAQQEIPKRILPGEEPKKNKKYKGNMNQILKAAFDETQRLKQEKIITQIEYNNFMNAIMNMRKVVESKMR